MSQRFVKSCRADSNKSRVIQASLTGGGRHARESSDTLVRPTFDESKFRYAQAELRLDTSVSVLNCFQRKWLRNIDVEGSSIIWRQD